MKKGFTMLEVLVVMGIFVLIGGFTLFVSMETFRGTSFRSDRDLLVAALQRARAQAMNNVCFGAGCADGEAHGVFIDDANNKYIIFQDSSYTPNPATDAVFDSSPTSNPAGDMEIVFEQLTGNATCGSPPCEISLTQGSQNSVISVSPEGQITWTN